MALQDLLNKINSDAEAEIENILQKAKAEEEEIKKETEKLLADLEFKNNLKIKELTETETKRQLSAEAGKNQKEIENFKREALDQTFDQALKTLSNLPESEKEKIYRQLLNSLPANWSGILLTSPEEKELLQSIAGDNFTVQEDKSIKGGFIAQGEESEYNFSWRVLVTTSKTKTESQIAEKLFQA